MSDEQNLNLNDREPKLYEIGFLLSPLVTETAVTETVAKEIGGVILTAGGKVEAEINPVLTKLAYSVTKTINHKNYSYKDAYFGAVRFSALPDSISKISEILDKSTIVIRYLITVTSADQPFEGPKASLTETKEEVQVSGEEVVVPTEPVTENKDLDQEIDNLLTETV